MRLSILTTILCAALMGGCASLPNVTTSYRLPRAELAITVTRTVGCNAATNTDGVAQRRILYSTSSVAPSPRYSADPGDEARVDLNMAALNSPLVNASMSVDYYDDGRLRGLNSATAGQGSAVLEAVARLAPIVAFHRDESAGPPPDPQPAIDAICREFDRVSPDGKPVSMIYEYREEFEPIMPEDAEACTPRTSTAPSNCSVAPAQLIPLSRRSADFGAPLDGIVRLNNMLGQYCVTFEENGQLDPARWTPSGNSMTLTLRLPVRYEVAVRDAARSGGTSGEARCSVAAAPLWSGHALIPLSQAASMVAFGNPGTYALPVPRGAVFGSNKLSLAVAESGAVTSLGYGAESGTAGAIGAVATAAGALHETDAERAGRYESQANIIAQQERLIRCRQNRETCE